MKGEISALLLRTVHDLITSPEVLSSMHADFPSN